MKIVYLVTSPISANIFGVKQLESLKKLPGDLYLICGEGEITSSLLHLCTSISKIKFLQRRISLINDSLSFFSLLKILREIKADIIIYSTPKAAFLGSIASKLCKVKIRLYQSWGAWWQNYSGVKLLVHIFLEKCIFLCSTHIIAVSKSLKDFYVQKTKFSRIEVLGFGSTTGIDSDIFYFKKEVCHEKKNLVIGYAGRICEDKGIFELLKIFNQLKFDLPNLNLEVVGDLDSQDYFSEKLVTLLRDTKGVFWTNHVSQSELASKMRNWNLQLFLSKREGLGNVILEAGACGVPTICWEIVGTRDAIPDFAKNQLVKFGDYEKLFDIVKQNLKIPIGELSRVDLANWYHKRFNQDFVLHNFVKFVKSLGVVKNGK